MDVADGCACRLSAVADEVARVDRSVLDGVGFESELGDVCGVEVSSVTWLAAADVALASRGCAGGT